MFRRRPLTQYFKAVFLFLGISGSMVFSQQGNLSEVKIGVVDLVTATVLHPLMSLYDFGRNGFFRVPVGLSERDVHERLSFARGMPEAKGQKLREKLQTLSIEASKLEDERKNLLMLPIGNSAGKIHIREQKLAELFNKLEKNKGSKFEFSFQLENPDLSSPSETRAIFMRIEKETLEAVQEAASLTCADLVLNQSLPPPGIWPDQSDKLYLFRERATWIDSGLYYAFLAKSANTNGKALKQFEKDVQLETFLELTRHPTAQNQLPIRPHPLVLKGGIDFTPEVVAILLEKYSYPSQTIQTVKRFLTDRKSETEKVEILK